MASSSTNSTNVEESKDGSQPSSKKRKTMLDYFSQSTSATEGSMAKTSKEISVRVIAKNKKSPLWKYFTKNDSTNIGESDKALCHLCQVTVSLGGRGRSANTSNLRAHLQINHVDEYRKICTGKSK